MVNRGFTCVKDISVCHDLKRSFGVPRSQDAKESVNGKIDPTVAS
jgi:hypothetical protein